MANKFLYALFGCQHVRSSFPITVRTRGQAGAAPLPARTYIVCLDCGAELPYDWNKMKIVTGERRPPRSVGWFDRKRTA